MRRVSNLSDVSTKAENVHFRMTLGLMIEEHVQHVDEVRRQVMVLFNEDDTSKEALENINVVKYSVGLPPPMVFGLRYLKINIKRL